MISVSENSFWKKQRTLLFFFFFFHYIDGVLSLNFKLVDFLDQIYPIEVEIKHTTDTARSASYLDLHLEIDNEGRLGTKSYDRRNHSNFLIVA
jgi:hypothetical protein